MNIYAIRKDSVKFQGLNFNIDDCIGIRPKTSNFKLVHDFSIKNLQLSEFWKLARTEFSEHEDKDQQIPDITKWVNATLMLSPKAFHLLSYTLQPYGEFLPVIIDDDIYQIFNCLTTAKVEEGACSEGQLVFDEDSIGESLIFKSPFQKCCDIYCTTRLKTLIQEFKFKGVMFEELETAAPQS